MSVRRAASSTAGASSVRARAVERFRERGIALPTFAELADPERVPARVARALQGVDPDAPHPLNLYRVHWFNAADRRARAAVPERLVLPEALTGVQAPILVATGNRFPLIRAHKPSAVIMDINLPGINGIEAFKQLHADTATKAIPVIALTASVTPTDRSAITAAGFDGFVGKPINLKEFIDTVKRLVEGAKKKT